ncbi:FG-GAP repeat protein [Streptomyces sp. NPDC058251]
MSRVEPGADERNLLPSPHRPPARFFEPSTASGDLDKDGYDDLVVGQRKA